jgi:hypothetical protein
MACTVEFGPYCGNGNVKEKFCKNIKYIVDIEFDSHLFKIDKTFKKINKLVFVL